MAKTVKNAPAKKVLTKIQLIKELNKIIDEAEKKTAIKLELLLKKNGYYYNSNPCCCVDGNDKLIDDHGGYQLASDGIITREWRHYVMSAKTVLKSL